MNCDQVFEVLTRGPFPTGSACDMPVEAHLRSCADCRRLAEALRPALELFQEAIDPQETRDLPGYWCTVAVHQRQPAVARAKDLSSRRTAGRSWDQIPVLRSLSAIAVWRLAAALLLGATVGGVLSARGSFNAFSPLPPGVARHAEPVPPDDDQQPRVTLSQRQEWAVLPAACFRHRPGVAPRYSVTTPQVLAQADLANLNCCSECHNANSDSISKTAVLAVSQACQVCHKD